MVNKNQRVFNSMVLHLYNQGEQCASKPGHCVYRKGSKRCVFGALIPGSILDKLTPRQKSLNASSLIESSKELQQLFEGVSVGLLTDMQYWHDSMEVVNERGGDLRFVLHKMEKTLRRVAESHDLSTAVFSPYTDTCETTLFNNTGQKPPHEGFWYTQYTSQLFCSDAPAWRYWDGERWSRRIEDAESVSVEVAEIISALKVKTQIQENIAYSNYWPENARVPRLNPKVPQWTN